MSTPQQSSEHSESWFEHIRSIPVPSRLATRPKDSRGYVVTFTTPIDGHQNPVFLGADIRARWRCAREQLCGLCGEALDAEMVGIAGATILQDEQPVFAEPLMHEECARYAAAVCPFLGHCAYDKYSKHTPSPPGVKFEEWATPRSGRPNDMLFVFVDGFTFKPAGKQDVAFFPRTIVRTETLPRRFGDIDPPQASLA